MSFYVISFKFKVQGLLNLQKVTDKFIDQPIYRGGSKHFFPNSPKPYIFYGYNAKTKHI
jgi:hypothetical protein